MKEKRVDVLYLLLMGSGLIATGIFVLNTDLITLKIFAYLLGIVFVMLGLAHFFQIFKIIFTHSKNPEDLKHLNDKTYIIRGFINIIAGIIILAFPGLPITLFGLITGMYFLLLSIIRGINVYKEIQDHLNGRLVDSLLCLFYLVIGIFFMFSPYYHADLILNIISVYFIIYGVNFYKDLLKQVIPEKNKDKIKRRIRFVLPPFIYALLPRMVLEEVNRMLEPSSKYRPHSIPEYVNIKNDEKPDIEVLIHTSKQGAGIIGHVDLIIDEKVISYGNYDSNSWRLMEGLGDGVLFIADVHKYIPFVIKDSKKTLFAFGIKLNEMQNVSVNNQIAKLKEDLVEWTPPAYERKDPVYAARLAHNVKTRFFKFKRGKFKTYFVTGTNCAKFADSIIGKAGLDILDLNGIITPGVYYDYLDREFARDGSIVISKKIYN